MECNQVTATDFRNIEFARVEFCGGVNILCGDNAQGKTNLLEAISLAALGKSFRTAHDEEMIRFGAEVATVSVDFTDSQRRQNITVRMMAGRKKHIEQNKVRMDRVSDMIGSFRAVLFCPEHLSLVKDGPGERRNFLDVALSQLYPLYLKSLQRYHRVLKQRNQLLRDAEDDRKAFLETADAWSYQLAHEAAIIAGYRYRYLLRAEEQVRLCFAEMTGEREIPAVLYVGSSGQAPAEYADETATEARYRELLTTRYDREIGAGTTLWGIHKDDVDIQLNGKSARAYCSQGQQRSLALAMKLAEGEVCAAICAEKPVFLFDDVFSELDAERRRYLSSKMQSRQVIMTTCETSSVAGDRLIRVKDGRYE